MAIVVTI